MEYHPISRKITKEIIKYWKEKYLELGVTEVKGMKGIFCKLCGDLYFFKEELRLCQCGNSRGKYITNMNVGIQALNDDYGSLFIVGIDNTLLARGVLPEYHGKPDFDFPLLFHHWGSAIIVVPPFTTKDVIKMDFTETMVENNESNTATN